MMQFFVRQIFSLWGFFVFNLDIVKPDFLHSVMKNL